MLTNKLYSHSHVQIGRWLLCLLALLNAFYNMRLSAQAEVPPTISASASDSPASVESLLQQAYLKASNTNGSDLFGEAVAISGDTMVVGASAESSAASSVNGNQNDNSAVRAGAAYVFVRSSGSGVWSQQAYLKASNSNADDLFGTAVAIDGNTIVIGATGEDSAATGVNGNQNDNSLAQPGFGGAGAAYVFVRSGTGAGATWSQQAYLKASNTGLEDSFGNSVAISGDTIVVGANTEKSIATGVNGNQNDNSAIGAGAAYVFVRNGTSWSQQAYLKASNTEEIDFFASSVAVSGNTIVVSAPGEDSNATGVNGNQNGSTAPSSGAAYVFVRSGTVTGGTWSQQAYLKASNTNSIDSFGSAVAVDGDTIVVGATGEDSATAGVNNGNQGDNSLQSAGAAYVFVRSGTGAGATWSQQAYVKASNPDRSDFFGTDVAVDGDTIVVSAVGEDSAATGINGNQNDNSLVGDFSVSAGAAYYFVRNGTGAGATWSQPAYLKASNTGSGDAFGVSAGLDAGTIVVGARFESSAASGINGNQADNSAFGAGAAYVFADLVVAQPVLFLSSADGGTVGGIAFADEDILAFNQTNNSWSLYFDGSDVISRSNDIDAFSLLPDSNILLSFNVTQTVTGLGQVAPADVVKFTPTSLGTITSGSFAWYLDGSDVGLESADEDIDAIAMTAGGQLVISTRGPFSVPGLAGPDEDLIVLDNGVFGANSGGTWRHYFDGSDVSLGIAGVDVKDGWINPAANQIYVATQNANTTPIPTGDDDNVAICTHTSLGNTTACAYTIAFDGDLHGFGGQHIDGVEVGTLSQVLQGSAADNDEDGLGGGENQDPEPEDGPGAEAQNQRVYLPIINE